MNTFYNIINWISLFTYWGLIINVSIRIMMKRRSVSSSMSWLLVIYIFPLIGTMVYLLFGELNLGKCRTKRSKYILLSIIKLIEKLKLYHDVLSVGNNEIAKLLFQLCKNRQGIGGIKGNKIKLLTSTNNILQTLIQDIHLAQNNIEMTFYIWKTGGIVDKVTEALINAAKRGVCCRLILDSAGSIDFFRSPCFSMMRSAGINIAEALHINIFRIFIRRMDLRQHRKMILIDNNIAYTGSMNMVDPNLYKKKLRFGQWIDIMVRIRGPIVIAMKIIFSYDWEMETGERIFTNVLKNINLPIKKLSGRVVQVIASGPGFFDGFIHQVLLTSVYSAKKFLIITTPYMVPSDDLLHALCTAAQRGVKVYIIIPLHNDSILVRWASRAFFSELLEAGVLIYQFQDGLLHTKSVIIDGKISLLGTVNLDMRSLWLNFEVTLVIDDNKFCKDLFKIQKEYISKSQLVEIRKWCNRPYWQRIIEQLFYFFSPLL